MKNFDEFLKTVDMEKMISSTIDSIEKSDNFATTITALSTSISINLLRQYHEWLSSQQE